ncbi:MAG: phosphoribosylamine--glycine ligase [Hyphomonadaceae bacterium]|nr:phosphoribosylamine--glycine ligase [Hyphomonadaceae bacterium]
MNILILGSGGREHALAWKIAQSALVDQVLCAPGNPGMDEIGPCFDIDPSNVEQVVKLVLQVEPDLIVIGPEAPLAAGVSDVLRARGFDVFGPSQAAAQLETSKAFSKERMVKYGVPTAAYRAFGAGEEDEAEAFLESLEPPYVLKADGLAAGKGVSILSTLEEAKAEARTMLGGKFGNASANLVIEEFMAGEEASLFVITDGEGAIYLPAAQDHKRLGEGDSGPNTGGMGAYAPAPVLTGDMFTRAVRDIVEPMLAGMAADGMPYQGVLYVGLMITETGPKVVEFNARFGDPECQALMAGLAGDIVPALLAAATQGLKGNEAAFEALLDLENFRPAVTVILASEGYPYKYDKGQVIAGVEAAGKIEGVEVFQAGTDRNGNGDLINSGGRVLAVTAIGDTLETAFQRAYQGVEVIDWPGGIHRRDIGWRVREK